MPRVDLEALADQKLTRVFVSLKLAEARRAEELLAARGVDYVVTVEAVGRTLLGSPRNAAVFSVHDSQAVSCVSALVEAGLGAGVIGRE
jgi:hypothetical protein